MVECRCIVCGKDIQNEDDAYIETISGEPYTGVIYIYLCSEKCRREFIRNFDKYRPKIIANLYAKS
jgi:YHS domain-containing protein